MTNAASSKLTIATIADRPGDLRDWLETVRASAIAEGESIERPALSEAEPSQTLSERQLKIAVVGGTPNFGGARRSIRADG